MLQLSLINLLELLSYSFMFVHIDRLKEFILIVINIIKAFNNMFHIFLVFVNKLNYYT